MRVVSWMLCSVIIGVTDTANYLTSYRHKEFGIGAELQQAGPGSPSGQHHGYLGREYSDRRKGQVYDRRYHRQTTWRESAPSSSSAAAAAAAASGSAASAASAASGSAAAAASAAQPYDRRQSYEEREQKQIYQYPAPRYIPREYDKQPYVDSRGYVTSTHAPVHRRQPDRAPVYVQRNHPSVYQPRTAAPSYYQPTHPPVYIQPTQSPVYIQPTQRPIYVQPTQRPIYVQPTQRPIYVQPTQRPIYIQPTQGPVYVQPTQRPIYIQPTQGPVYVQPTYVQQTQPPVHVQTSQSGHGAKPCSSSSLCFCCRWTTKYSQSTEMCKQPKYETFQQKVCTAIRNGACIRFDTMNREEQTGSYSAPCTSTRRERFCGSCCPSRYGQGMPRCSVTATSSVQQPSNIAQTAYHHSQSSQTFYSGAPVGAVRSAPTVYASAAASVSAPGYPGVQPAGRHQPARPYTAPQTQYPQEQHPPPQQRRGVSSSKARNVICCFTTRRPDCCQSSRQRATATSARSVNYRPQPSTTDCCSTTRRPECCSSVRQYTPQRSVQQPPSYPIVQAVQGVWQPPPPQQRQQPTDCCSTTRQPECCINVKVYVQPTQYQSSMMAAPPPAWNQGDCCSTTRRPECCASSRASLGVPVSRSRTTCCGSSQPQVTCCVSLRLADCCGSSRLNLCCRVTNNVGKCCSGASSWGK